MKSQTVKTKMASKTIPVVAKSKKVSKPLIKPTVKPKVKTAGKPVALVNALVKVASKKSSPAKKTPVKTAVRKQAVKTATKAVAKGTKVIKVTKAVKTKPAKAPTAAVKVKSKDSVNKTLAKTSQTKLLKPKQKQVSSVPAAKPVAATAPLAPPLAAPIANPANGIPVRAGRPSSRLVQLTVPSMAQSVASTAAKASFTQTTLPLPIVSPLASAVKKNPKLAKNWMVKPLEQLTDADVIAMPDSEYMNDTQMRFFRLKLMALKHDMLSNAGETTEHLRADTVVVPDPADRATIEEEHALELRTRDRERKLLKKIEQSIVRIDSGDYGYCDETGEPIGVARLIARPTANLSLEAQQRRELKQKMFGD